MGVRALLLGAVKCAQPRSCARRSDDTEAICGEASDLSPLAVQYASYESQLHGPPPLGGAAVCGIRRRSTARRRNQGRSQGRRDGGTKEAGGPTSTARGGGG